MGGRVNGYSFQGSTDNRCSEDSTMRVRLIGAGEVGEALVLACVREFDRLGIQSMLESHRVARLSSSAFQQTLSKVLEAVQGLLNSPREEMWLRGGLSHL